LPLWLEMFAAEKIRLEQALGSQGADFGRRTSSARS
jgi:hypothetical protein